MSESQGPSKESEIRTDIHESSESKEHDYLRLRTLILGEEYESAIKRYIGKDEDVERVSDVLTDAIECVEPEKFGNTLAPIVEQAISTSIEKNPSRITSTIFPIIGPTIRKAVAAALSEMVQSLNTLLEKSLTLGSVNWRLQAWRSGTPYAEYVLLHTLQYRVEQVLLVHRETGLLLNSVTAQEVKTQDPELVSSMLTAISDFVSDSFSDGSETLERVRFGELELYLFAGPHAILAIAIRGAVSDELTHVANETIESIHQSFHYPLTHFEGDREPFDETNIELSKCLLSKKIEQKEKSKPWLAIVVLFIGMVYLAIASYQSWQLDQRMNDVEHLIHDEPGYVLISSRREDKNLDINILRSQSSREVEEFTQSLDSIADIHLNIESDLVHFGEIPPPIIEQRIVQPEKPSPSELEQFQSLVQQINSTHFFFDSNAVSLNAAELEKLPDLVQQLRKLLEIGNKLGISRIQIMVMGFADSYGTKAKNQQVSQERADTLKSLLQSNLADTEFIVAWGLGSLDSENVDEDMQRRVSLQVLYSASDVSQISLSSEQGSQSDGAIDD